MSLHNLAREYTLTTGTADAVLSGAVPGCNTWDNAGVANGETVHYCIITYSLATHRPTHSEVGTGTYTTATKTLARTTVVSSTNGGAKITLTGLSEVFISPQASEIGVGSGVQYASFYAITTNDVTTGATQSPVNLTNALANPDNLATLSANVLTINVAGFYELVLVLACVKSPPDAPISDGNVIMAIEHNASGSVVYGDAIPIATVAAVGQAVVLRHTVVRHIQLAGGDTLRARFVNNTALTINVGVSELTLTKKG